jgi:intracellular multiplication protein IcmL
MAEEELRVVQLREDFYRDSFGKVILIIISIFIAIFLLVALSLYLYLNIPSPVVFPVDKEWRIQPPVPLDKPYLPQSDLLQWVGDALQRSFVFDFNHYNEQLKVASQFFTADGWKVFLNQLNIYANYNTVQANKVFVNSAPAGAPVILNQGLLSGRYAWWVQMPINLNYAGLRPPFNKTLILQVLVVRVSTLNNLTGVGIDNVIVATNAVNAGTQGIGG